MFASSLSERHDVQQRRITASYGDLNTLLFGEDEPRSPGAAKWKNGKPPEFVSYVRAEAQSFDDLLDLLTHAIHGDDPHLSSIAAEDVAEAVDEGWDLHPATIEAVRSCNLPAYGKGFDAGVVLATARHLRDFSIEYFNEKGEEATDLYCMKEKDGPSTFSIHLGKDAWLLHDATLSIPAMPHAWQAAMIGRPLREILDHPCIGPEDMVDTIERSDKLLSIKGMRPRAIRSLELTPHKMRLEEGKSE